MTSQKHFRNLGKVSQVGFSHLAEVVVFEIVLATSPDGKKREFFKIFTSNRYEEVAELAP